jgi:hypothetical protein
MKPAKQRLDPLHRHFLPPPSVPLYHYTSLEVLEKITAKGGIWATDVNFFISHPGRDGTITDGLRSFRGDREVRTDFDGEVGSDFPIAK